MAPLPRWPPSRSTNESEPKARQTAERERNKLPVEEGHRPNCGRTESEATNTKERALPPLPPPTYRRRHSRGPGAKEGRKKKERVRSEFEPTHGHPPFSFTNCDNSPPVTHPG